MNGLRAELLAGARLARHEDRGARARNPLDELVSPLHRAGSPHEARETRKPIVRVLLRQRDRTGRAAPAGRHQAGGEQIGTDGLDHEVHGATAHGIDCEIDRGAGACGHHRIAAIGERRKRRQRIAACAIEWQQDGCMRRCRSLQERIEPLDPHGRPAARSCRSRPRIRDASSSTTRTTEGSCALARSPMSSDPHRLLRARLRRQGKERVGLRSRGVGEPLATR
jgi:hypothetical protein